MEYLVSFVQKAGVQSTGISLIFTAPAKDGDPFKIFDIFFKWQLCNWNYLSSLLPVQNLRSGNDCSDNNSRSRFTIPLFWQMFGRSVTLRLNLLKGTCYLLWCSSSKSSDEISQSVINCSRCQIYFLRKNFAKSLLLFRQHPCIITFLIFDTCWLEFVLLIWKLVIESSVYLPIQKQ